MGGRSVFHVVVPVGAEAVSVLRRLRREELRVVRTVRLGKASGLEKFTIETPEEFYQVLKDHFMIDAPFVLKRP